MLNETSNSFDIQNENVRIPSADNNMDSRNLVIVLSRNYATQLSIIRSLGAAGHTVDLIAVVPKEGDSEIAAVSKYVRNATERVVKKVQEGRTGGDDALLEELMKYAGQYPKKPVLFPTDDFTASVIDRYRSTLEPHFILPTIAGGSDGCLTRSMDKTFQSKLAREVGLSVPMEWAISLKEEIRIPDDMVYPCFVKPITTQTGYKKEMAVCDDEEELVTHLEALRSSFADRSILVQEFMGIDSEIGISGICLDQEVLIPAIVKKAHMAQHERGITLAGTVAPFDEIRPVQENILNLLKKLRYVGMFDIELYLVDGKIYFNEINLCNGISNYAYFQSGVNLPDLFVKAITGQSYSPEETKITVYGKSFVYENAAWNDYIHGFMTKKELNKKLSTADILLLSDPNDPAPASSFSARKKAMAKRHRSKQFKTGIKTYIIKPLLPFYRALKARILNYPQLKKKNQRDPNAEVPRVLITGRNYCSNLCLARAFGSAGYEIEILRVYQTRLKFKSMMRQMRPDIYSKYIKAYHECNTHKKPTVLVNALINQADPNRKMLLIPADDLAASIVDEHYDLLSQYYLIPSIGHTQGAISQLMNKETQMTLARNAGLPVINGALIKTEHGQFEIPDTVTYPCFVKPNISKNASKTKMRRCESREELEQTLAEYSANRDVEMLVEDFVNIEKEYALLGLSTKDGVIAPGLFLAERGGHGGRKGVAMFGRVLPIEPYQELISDIRRFIGTLNYEGLFDVDLIQANGKIYFVELNLRYGGSGYAITASGANLPGMFADHMLRGKPIDLQCKIDAPGKTFVSEKIMIDEYVEKYITYSEMKQLIDSADIHFIKNQQDMHPYRHFRKFYPIARLFRFKYQQPNV